MKTKLVLTVLTLFFFFTGVTVKAQNCTGDSEKKQERVDIAELRLSKSFNGQSIETTKEFPVGANYSMLKMQLRGQVKSGTIKLTLVTPKGNKFKTIEIDAASDVQFEQELNLKVNPSEWTGDWQLKIKTDKADGSYRLQIYTR